MGLHFLHFGTGDIQCGAFHQLCGLSLSRLTIQILQKNCLSIILQRRQPGCRCFCRLSDRCQGVLFSRRYNSYVTGANRVPMKKVVALLLCCCEGNKRRSSSYRKQISVMRYSKRYRSFSVLGTFSLDILILKARSRADVRILVKVRTSLLSQPSTADDVPSVTGQIPEASPTTLP
ncbi:PREDICTED: uncharacterized protein LOC101305487 [Fragaria vesca subsp. vesca]